MNMEDKEALLNSVISITRQAGRRIIEAQSDGSLDIVYKADKSPLTTADTIANDYIISELSRLTPSLPIISEESLNNVDNNQHAAEFAVWLVDPLDGTKGFIKGNQEYTVNIALIYNHIPILGVVYAPALDLLYFGLVGKGAYKQEGELSPVVLRTRKANRKPVIVASLSHLNAETKEWLKEFGDHRLIRIGSSLKICLLAEGKADIYPRLSPIMEWDIAAADLVLRMAGGRLVQSDNKAMPIYNKPDLHQPPFVAYSFIDS